MRIPQPPPPPTLALKPQLHTHKNHHTYNGVRRLPQSTHVRVITHPANNNKNNNNNTSTTPTGTTSTLSRTDTGTSRYVITLRYPHNRTCELYRTAYDIDLLRRALGVLCHPVAGRGNGSPGGDSSSSSKAGTTKDDDDGGDAAASGERDGEGDEGCSTVCTRSCSCPCACAEQGCDARAAAGVQSMLGEALRKMEAGDTRAEVTMEWFLKRRIGDCGGR